METTGRKMEVNQAVLTEIEQRAVRVNGALSRMVWALQRGDLEAIANLRALAQELNWTNRKALVAAGAGDSCADHSTVWDEDEEPVLGEKLDLGELSSLPMSAPESGE